MTRAQAKDLPLLVADVYELAGRLRRSGDVLARDEGQSQTRWQLLSVVSDGEWTVPHAADRLGVTRQSVQRIADELVADRLATFEPNRRHRRSPFVALTPAGRDALERLTARARERAAQWTLRITGDDMAITRRTLSALLETLRNEEMEES